MRVTSSQRTSSRLWLVWPLVAGAAFVGIGFSEIIPAGASRVWDAAVMLAVVAYAIGGVFVMELLGARFVWTVRMSNSQAIKIKVTDYAFGKYVVHVDGMEVRRGRSLRLLETLDFPLTEDPTHRALLTIRSYRWPPRVSLDVDGERVLDA